MSMIKGVITGDLVNSTNIAAEWRQAVVGALYKCAADFSPLTPINIEMYRGDSFQVVVGNPEYALTVAVAFRAKLRASTPEKKEMWDARVSVGIGDVSFESDNIVTSDGEVQGHADLQDGRCTVVLLPRCAAETYGLRDDACEGAGDSFRARGAGERVVFNCVEKIESIFEMKIYF